MENVGDVNRQGIKLRWILFGWNSICLVLGLIMYCRLNSLPPTVPDAIRYATRNLDKSEVVSQLIQANQTIDYAFDLIDTALFWWIGAAVSNLVILLVALFLKVRG